MLSIGTAGDQVKQLQDCLNTLAQSGEQRLRSNAPLLVVDGKFGSRTQSRVKEFQGLNRLSVDGIVGALTLGVINAAMDALKKILPPPPTAAYARMFALIYAATFHNRICSDGRIATKAGYPLSLPNGVKLTPGIPFAETGFIAGQEDCTHFISCCIGRPPVMKFNGIDVPGGGLHIQTASHMANVGAYGQDYVPNLLAYLVSHRMATIIQPQFRPTTYHVTRDAILLNLRPGDLIAYASKDDARKYEHFAILVGPTTIACHTQSRYGDEYDRVPHSWATLLQLG
jgi:hypothetical protein